MNYRQLAIGDPVETVTVNTSFGPNIDLDSLAGHHIALLFVGTLDDPAGAEALKRLMQLSVFNGRDALLIVVLYGSADKYADLPKQRGMGYVFDHDLRMSRQFGAAPDGAETAQPVPFRRLICVFSPRLQVDRSFEFSQIDAAVTHLVALKDPGLYLGFEVFAPILIIPNIFEPELCRALMAQHDQQKRDFTGSMRRDGDKTVEVVDAKHKVRRDFLVEDEAILNVVNNRIRVRIRPEIKKVHQFDVTRIERNLVGCYRAEDGGHFRPHRDNTTPATLHRRFAVSINLNEDFEGGEVGFPEYGSRTYRPPPGGCVVFSCSLLHCVSRVTRGARYAYLPFLYDAEGSRIRAANIGSYAGASFKPVEAEAST
jgi:predicted 2-oxoglutarate/Fe(II)-dependent dioxygenase YbiX